MTGTEAAAAGMARRIHESFSRQGLMRHLGAQVVHVEPGKVRLRLPFATQLTQQHGFFHAGATSAIADTAGGYAGLSVFPPESSVLTVEFKINLVAPAQGDALEAVGRVVRAGKTLTVCDLKVYALNGATRVLVALGQQTLICLHNTPDD